MNIDRSNYEIWFTDWLDGNLNDNQLEKLRLFLDINPELKEEFDELDSLRLMPSTYSYPNKYQLKKSDEDLPLSPFENLCIGYLENDLTSEQKIELSKNVEHDKKKEKTFKLIQKIKLDPPVLKYKHKKRLIRKKESQRVLTFSFIGLSAAAVAAIILLNYILVPKNLQDNIPIEAHLNATDNITTDQLSNKASEKIITDNIPSETKQNTGIALTSVKESSQVKLHSIPLTSQENDIFIRPPESREIPIAKVPVHADINFESEIFINNLILHDSDFEVLPDVNRRSKLVKYISKTFREVILKEKTSTDSPLKGYEIAEAGVTGLNKLFGWEMEFNKYNDSNGELKSIYFSSKILKIKTPVKNP